MKALLVALASLVLGLWLPSVAWASAAPPQVQLQLEADTVGVGDVVHLQVSVTSGDEMPSDVQVGATPGFIVRRKSPSSSQSFALTNGSATVHYTLTVDWELQAQRVGSFSLGPLTVRVGNNSFQTEKVAIRVVPAGQAPAPRPRPQQRRDPFGAFPFDPFRGLFPGLDDHSQEPPPAPAVTIDPRLSLDAARGDYFFLHATVDKTAAVVGEQVIFTVYEYLDASIRDLSVDADQIHDAQVADFVKHPLIPDDQEGPAVGFASAGGRTWAVHIAHRWSVFPLRPGDLVIQPMSVTLTRPRSAAGQSRSTESIVIHVVDPPMTGRPPGFSSGDVGHFSLSAQVQPRQIEQGGAVGVHVELSGTGNIPASLTPPARDGIEWLTPEEHAELGPTGQGGYGGKRTFDFVVHVTRAGAVDLGEVSLPYWDSEQRKYAVARAALGTVTVTPNAALANAAKGDAQPQRLDGLPLPRDGLEGVRVGRGHWDDSPYFWLAGVLGGPLAFGLAVTGRASFRAARSRWHGRKASPLAELRNRMAAVRKACERSDSRAIDASITRALEAATVAHAKVGVRGATGAEVAGRLERAGVQPRVAADVSSLLGECEKARFAPEATDAFVARARAARALEVIRALEKTQ